MGESEKQQSPSNPDDMSWGEVAQLGKRYLKIPAALVLVEIFYWFLTQPVNTLAPIQVSEAWIWHHLVEMIYGSGTSELLYHNGWLTKMEFAHIDFPGHFNTVSLYVSDECAGVHEMIFISTLILLTDGVPQRLRIKSALVMCGIVYVLNIVRLLAFYPIAINSCTLNPDDPGCLDAMWQFHTAVYEWGFLLVLVVMWLVWFKWVNGGKAIKRASEQESKTWKFAYRNNWQTMHKLIVGFCLLIIIGAAANVMLDPVALEAKEKVDMCNFLEIVNSDCGNAQQEWSNSISESWSLVSLGLVGIIATVMRIEQPQTEEE